MYVMIKIPYKQYLN